MTTLAHPFARPFAAAGVALVAAGTLSATALTAPAAPALPQVAMPDIALQASVADIITLPVYRQSFANAIEFLGIELNGLAQSATGVVTSIASIPPTVATVVQQLSAADVAGAFQTINDALVTAGEAIFVPPVAALITVAQQQLAIQGALQLAVPLAWVDLATGLSSAFTGVSTAVILATQSILAAASTLNPSTIVTAVGEGVQSVGQAVVTGGGDIVNGIASAQDGLVAALQTRVPPVTPPVGGATPAAAIRAAASVPASARTSVAVPSAAAVNTARAVTRSVAATVRRDTAPGGAVAPRAAASRHASR